VDESGGVLPESESLTSEAKDTAVEASATPEVATEPDSSPQLQVGAPPIFYQAPEEIPRS
jgi:hypothetical protein